MARPKLDKTNAIRLLEAKRVPYEALTYDPEIHSAVGVAEALGVPPEQVYKTLVVLDEGPGSRPLLVMIAEVALEPALQPHEIERERRLLLGQLKSRAYSPFSFRRRARGLK